VMTVLESLGLKANFELLASDIDSKVLASAKQGVYRVDALKGINSQQMQRFFLKGKGSNAGMAMAKPELREYINFSIVNLIGNDWPFRDLFDVIFCRNVMIYFDAQTQRRVLEKMYKVMKPGALLFVGHAENFSDSRDLFVLKGKTVYERQ
jgi:chemotaxis protein methyltransferase CheR